MMSKKIKIVLFLCICFFGPLIFDFVHFYLLKRECQSWSNVSISTKKLQNHDYECISVSDKDSIVCNKEVASLSLFFSNGFCFVIFDSYGSRSDFKFKDF
jgi:hypothetical protein